MRRPPHPHVNSLLCVPPVTQTPRSSLPPPVAPDHKRTANKGLNFQPQRPASRHKLWQDEERAEKLEEIQEIAAIAVKELQKELKGNTAGMDPGVSAKISLVMFWTGVAAAAKGLLSPGGGFGDLEPYYMASLESTYLHHTSGAAHNQREGRVIYETFRQGVEARHGAEGLAEFDRLPAQHHFKSREEGMRILSVLTKVWPEVEVRPAPLEKLITSFPPRF